VAKDVNTRQEVLVDVFSQIERFLNCLESYTQVQPTSAMTSIIVEIMVEILAILEIATNEIKQRQSSDSVSFYHSFLA
jgi:hypothetical protein